MFSNSHNFNFRVQQQVKPTNFATAIAALKLATFMLSDWPFILKKLLKNQMWKLSNQFSRKNSSGTASPFKIQFNISSFA